MTKKRKEKTSDNKDLEEVLGSGGEPGEFTTKYLSSLEKLGVVVNGEPVPHKDLVKAGKHLELSTSERSYLTYLRHKTLIKEKYLESKSWDEVVILVAVEEWDVDEAQEAFIDYVGEVYNTKVKDAKHLQELTGISNKTLKKHPYEEPSQKTSLEEIIICARYSKYQRELSNGVTKGLKYKHLLKIKPKMFELPENWEDLTPGDRIYNQYTAILSAIGEEFALIDMESGGLSLLPSLRAMANELEAPYSVLMDAYKVNSFTPPSSSLHYIRTKKDIQESISSKIQDVIKKQSKTWRQERLLDNPKADNYPQMLSNFEWGISNAIEQLATERLDRVLGTKNPPIEFAEDYRQFIVDNFSDEIEETTQSIIRLATKGKATSKGFKEIIKLI